MIALPNPLTESADVVMPFADTEKVIVYREDENYFRNYSRYVQRNGIGIAGTIVVDFYKYSISRRIFFTTNFRCF